MVENGSTFVFGELDRLARSTGAKSARAQFAEMSRSGRGYRFMEQAGVSVSTRTQFRWLSGESHPSKANSRAISEAYSQWKRENMGPRLAARLNNGGYGTTIEVTPKAPPRDHPGRARANIDVRTPTITDWDEIVEAWRNGDHAAGDSAWAAMISAAVGSPGPAYFDVDNVVILEDEYGDDE